MNNFPDSIFLHIFSFLEPQELCKSVAPVNRHWKALAEDWSLWKRHFYHLVRPHTSDHKEHIVRYIINGIERHIPQDQITADAVFPDEPKDTVVDWFAAYRDRYINNVLHEGFFEVIGAKPAVSDSALQRIRSFESYHGVKLPPAVVKFFSLEHITQIVFRVFPTNNHLRDPSRRQWVLLKCATSGQHVLKIMNENQGCCYWYIKWEEGDIDPPVYVSEEDYERKDGPRVIPDLTLKESDYFSSFWQQLANDGLDWYQVHMPTALPDFSDFEDVSSDDDDRWSITSRSSRHSRRSARRRRLSSCNLSTTSLEEEDR
eukprot:Colp12_sorted_trinity150504_noHs@15475